jgi:hypothetical protein
MDLKKLSNSGNQKQHGPGIMPVRQTPDCGTAAAPYANDIGRP